MKAVKTPKRKIPKSIRLGAKLYKVIKYDRKKKSLLVSLQSIELKKVIGKVTGKEIEVPICEKPFYLAYPVLNPFILIKELFQ